MALFKPARRANKRFRLLILLVSCICAYVFFSQFSGRSELGAIVSTEGVHDSLLLTAVQCRATFPELLTELDKIFALGRRFDVEKIDANENGFVQGRITDGKQRRSATLHALHRAIITSSEPIPDTFFSLSINDLPANNTWTLARPGDPRHYPGAPNNGDTSKPIEDWKPVGNYWPMPHYSSWSWGMPYIGTLDEALSRIERIEAKHPKWSDKIPKAIWRGTEGFNPMWNTQLRPSLVRLARDKPWADVEPLHNSNPRVKNNNVVSIEDFCRWRYIIYTEGITYSGRLPYHQACASVLITPPLHYLTHNTHLIKPMYASRVLELSAKDKESSELHPAFPVSYSPNEANTVFVQHDWSDLEDVIEWLEGRPEIGESIARNQQRLMVEGGYLTQAADACYWRSLIQAWALRVEVPKNEGYWTSGTRWETWVLDGK